MNLNKKRLLTLATAGFFAFSTTTAFAAENNEVGLEIVTETNEEETKAQTGEEKVDAPAVLPGDFFYFVKTAIEKIKLALTFDNEKEAKLLASYATQRLAEAEMLFDNGEQDKALETIKNAITYLESAEENTKKEEDEDSATSESDKDVVDEPIPDDSKDSIETTPLENEESVNEVERLISQNIIALTAALEKVKNPTAKAALQKNIEKSYAKLLKKIEKVQGTEVDISDETEEKTTNTPVETEEKASNTPVEIEEPVASVEETVNEKELGIEPAQANEQKVVKEIKNKVKQSVKEVKKEQKEVKKQIKQEQRIEKQLEKQQRKEMKQEAKEEKHKGKHGKNHQEQKHNGKDK